MSSTPTPSPTPTPVAAQNVGSLSANASFTTTAAKATAIYDLSVGKVTNSDNKQTALQVSYNAATRSYSLTSGATSGSFGPSQVAQSHFTGEQRYESQSGNRRDLLTLVTTPYSGSVQNKYVGLGYWERMTISGSVQNSEVDFFTYGFATPAANIPKQGSLSYKYDIFGLLTIPSKEPHAVSGNGAMQFDLASGTFRGSGFVSENSIASTAYASGYLKIETTGTLGSGNAFSGYISYTSGNVTPDYKIDHLAGSLSGLFYGSNAEEFGAAFTMSSSATGANFTGAMTGQKDENATLSALTLSNLTTDTTFDARKSELRVIFETTSGRPVLRDAAGWAADTWWQPGKVTLKQNGGLTVQTTYNTDPRAEFTAADRSAIQRPNFISYDTANGTLSSTISTPVHFDLYKIGKDNPELQLSYVGFGIWSQPYSSNSQPYGNYTYQTTIYSYVLFGLETPKYLFNERTGSASYQGVVYANSTLADGTLLDVGGTSQFAVDFGAHRFSGSLDLATRNAGGGQTALGKWTFADAIVDGQLIQTALSPVGPGSIYGLDANAIVPRFYGPQGEEIGATFSIKNGIVPANGTVSITGVTVARVQP